jgi:hypothetical protein
VEPNSSLSREQLDDRDWRKLIRTIENGKCILLLGPGVATDPNDPERRPLTTVLAEQLAGELERKMGVRAVEPGNLAHVAQLYPDRQDVELAVEDFYAPYGYKDPWLTTELHRELAALPFSLCINTTLDAFFLNALHAAGKPFHYDFYDISLQRGLSLPDPSPDRPIVYNLYGSLGRKVEGKVVEKSSSLMVAEDDLVDFLVHVITKTPRLPPKITSMFEDKDASFLFLGFGFHHWYLRILLHVLKAHDPSSRSLALERPPFFSHPDSAEAAVYFERKHRIEFRKLSWEGFVSELRRRHGEVQRIERGPASAPVDAPIVFLCHVHENEDRAAEIAEALRARGIQTWLDKQNLRAGERWNQSIHRVLNQQAHYVLVLQSRDMNQVESYAFKEIDCALERQRGMPRFRFIIPAMLEPCEPVESLAHLQRMDLSTPLAMDELASIIIEDWQKRQQVAHAA